MMSKKIVILPVFNEEVTVVDVLNRLLLQVDTFIIVDDGSTDSSKQRIIEWKTHQNSPNIHFFSLKRNSGKGRVFWNCFCFIKHLLETNQIAPEDLIITIDADGQHKPENITPIVNYLEEKNFELVITKRDFFAYPFYKKLGNKLLSTWASIIGRFDFNDIESGFRVFQAKVLKCILPYYTGYRYSCEQEFGIIAARLKIKMDNDYPVAVDTYVPGARFRDAFWIVLMGIIAFGRVQFKLVNKRFDWEMEEVE
ncbi:MAG: glycosyltransferase family 2 protein [bacterium]|nr:glycosyltransferase family 2 protein [bacterium]